MDPLVKGISAVGLSCDPRSHVQGPHPLLQLAGPTGELQGGIIQSKGDKFCRGGEEARAGPYLPSPYQQGAVCWTPLAVL